jgi:hypothetical protein
VIAQNVVAQNSPLALVDTSGSGAPVSLSGTATIQNEPQHRFAFHISASNVSDKAILLRVIGVQIVGEGNEESPMSIFRRDECFFGADLFAAYTSEALEVSDDRPHEQSTASAVNIAVLFVQFVDGSTWGDPDEGKEALADRELTLKKLAELRRTYQTEGGAQFGAALMQQQPDVLINQLKSSYQTTGDAEDTMKLLNQKLHNAESHLEKMRKPAV